jgi:hypothetical protein
MTSFVDKKVGSFSVFQLFGIIGAILVIISFFLAWGTLDVTLLGNTDTTNYTGMDFFDKKVFAEGTDAYDAVQNMFPMICLVFAVISLILAIIPDGIFKGNTGKIVGIIQILICILLVVFSVLFIVWFGDQTGSITGLLGSISLKTGAGAYLCLVGSIMIAIVGILPLFKKAVN